MKIQIYQNLLNINNHTHLINIDSINYTTFTGLYIAFSIKPKIHEIDYVYTIDCKQIRPIIENNS